MSNTTLTVYDNINEPLEFVERFGTMIAKSRMFGCESEEQGQILAMACLAERRNPIEIKRTYHIIDGNLSMRSDAMIAELRNRGGKHKIISRTDERAEIQLEFQDQTITESLTWDEAKNEPWPFGKRGQIKKNWATPRARRQMLWARVVSEAVRTIAPEIIAGVYTPEETGDFADQVEEQPAAVDVNQLMADTAKAAESTRQDENEPIDAEYQVVAPEPEPDVPSVETSPEPEPTTDDNGSTAAQRSRLRELFDAIGATSDQIDKVLAKRDAKSFRQLTSDQAAELIAALEAKAKAIAEATGGESRMPADAKSSDVTGPVIQATIDQIKTLMSGDLEICKRVRDHLAANNKLKLSDLSQADGDLLLECLKTRAMENFFARSLEQPPF